MNRVLFFCCFMAIGALGFGWWYNYSEIQSKHNKSIENFMNACPRFTAEDGKELCEYVNVIGRHSIGFQQSGLPLLDCMKYISIGDR
jgi:hypothetical protein